MEPNTSGRDDRIPPLTPEKQFSPNHGRDLPAFLLVSEAAVVAKVSPWTIRNEIRTGRLRARRIGRLVRILPQDLAEWMHGDD